MSFLPDDPTIAALIEASLRALQVECPPAYAQLCALMAGREVLLWIDDERAVIVFDGGEARVVPEARAPCIWMRTSRQAILDLIDARLTLSEAVLDGAIALQGRVEDLALFHEGFLTYLRGAVRAPSFPALLDRFRRAPARLGHIHPTRYTD